MAKFFDIFCCFPWRRSRTPSESRSVEYITIHGISDISSDDIFEVTADIPLIEDTQIQHVPPTIGESQMTVAEPEELPVPSEASIYDDHSEPAPVIQKHRVLVIVIEMVKSIPDQSQDGCESLAEKTVSEPEPEPEKMFQPSETPESDDPTEPSPCAVSSVSSVCEEPAETSPLPLLSEACACVVPAEPSPTPEPSEDSACGYAREPSPEIYIPEEAAQDSSSDVEISSGSISRARMDYDDIFDIIAGESNTQSESAMSLQDFNLHKVLGRGSFGKVMLAEFKVTKEMFAIKTIKLAGLRSKSVQSILTERKIFKSISSVRHPFVVNLFASFHTDDRAFFAMEYAAGGSLKARLKSLQSFSEPMARFYTACVVLGLEFLHQKKIIHRDLKPDNIVLDKDGFAKITDFGVSKRGIGFGDRITGVCGTRKYMAPEMAAEKPYTRDVDWWAVGIMLYKMLTGKYPFNGKTDDKLGESIQKDRVRCPWRVSSRASALIKSLLTKDPVKRLGSQKGGQDVKDHLFFTEINWMDLLAKKTQPPFTPCLSGPEDVSNFDPKFTSQAPTLTPPRRRRVRRCHQHAFAKFDWVAE
uniref:Protein kinase domain-containing protein n=1 Tax=Leptobrachium leishanense TaxID=445787 RepID=A0A8C5MTX8_9ANUR